jgi:hypothetical protein
MQLKEYQVACTRTINLLGDPKLDLAHMGLGFASELSELYECIDKSPVDVTNLMEELGDQMWYIANWCTIRGMNLEDFDPKININIPIPEECITINQGLLCDMAKRWLAYGNAPQFQKHAGKERGYITSFIEAIKAMCDEFEIDFYKVLDKNILKLYDRYPGKFTQDNALIRDLEKERKTLEA